jgi:hypothetical protein
MFAAMYCRSMLANAYRCGHSAHLRANKKQRLRMGAVEFKSRRPDWLQSWGLNGGPSLPGIGPHFPGLSLLAHDGEECFDRTADNTLLHVFGQRDRDWHLVLRGLVNPGRRS